MRKGDFPFKKALQKDGLSFICEIKKASPSKGVIAEKFDCKAIAAEYEEAGADCISVLTEPDYFQGSDRYLAETASTVRVPVLRKDFTVDDYMIYQAKTLGADCVLLICSILRTAELARYLELCETLGLSAITEAHTEAEVDIALDAGADIIGVNNRNLKTFEVDVSTSVRLRERVGAKALFVAESGISTRADTQILEKSGVDGALIGETLMRCSDKKSKLLELRGKAL